MTDIDYAIEDIRRSFSGGSSKSPRFRYELGSPQQLAYAEASLRLIERGYLDENWSLTASGRAWALGAK